MRKKSGIKTLFFWPCKKLYKTKMGICIYNFSVSQVIYFFTVFYIFNAFFRLKCVKLFFLRKSPILLGTNGSRLAVLACTHISGRNPVFGTHWHFLFMSLARFVIWHQKPGVGRNRFLLESIPESIPQKKERNRESIPFFVNREESWIDPKILVLFSIPFLAICWPLKVQL